VEEAMAKLLTKSKYGKLDYLRKGDETLGLKNNIFLGY
jgi:hypothetical protein